MSGGASERGAKAARAHQQVERSLDALAESLAAGDSAALRAFLAAMSRFHRYSLSNVLLIQRQRPSATRVAGFRTWKSLGRSVKKGEQGIAILAPMVVKARRASEAEGDAEDDNQAPRVRGFRVVYVFDIAQTEGALLPGRVSGEPREMLTRLEAAIRARGIVLAEDVPLGAAKGVSVGGGIAVSAELPPAERFAVLCHELAHELLHQIDAEDRPPKVVRETEAEAVAFAVCDWAGLDTGTVAADYIRLHQGDRATLAASLDRIRGAAATIIQALEPEGERELTPHARAAARRGGREI